MNKSIRFVSLESWPGQMSQPVRAPFSAPYNRTLALLDRELGQINATQIVLQAFLRPNQIRQDGWPYSDARPLRPGVILSFQAPNKGALSFPCDRYKSYEDNIRAIALSLEALRAVDRYGVTQRAEQYAGWKQIEAPMPGGFRGKEDAAAFLATQADGDGDLTAVPGILTDPALRKFLYREAAARLHPDKRGGDKEMFVRLQQAMAILEPK